MTIAKIFWVCEAFYTTPFLYFAVWGILLKHFWLLSLFTIAYYLLNKLSTFSLTSIDFWMWIMSFQKHCRKYKHLLVPSHKFVANILGNFVAQKKILIKIGHFLRLQSFTLGNKSLSELQSEAQISQRHKEFTRTSSKILLFFCLKYSCANSEWANAMLCHLDGLFSCHLTACALVLLTHAVAPHCHAALRCKTR